MDIDSSELVDIADSSELVIIADSSELVDVAASRADGSKQSASAAMQQAQRTTALHILIVRLKASVETALALENNVHCRREAGME